MQTLAILISCLLSIHAIHADITDVAHFKEIEQHVTHDSLILLDIDDTLLIPKQMLGCDEWFQSRLNKHKQEGLHPPAALEKSLAEWEGIRHFTDMKVVEAGTELIVDKMQKMGYLMMGLTTQGLALATRTVQQLQENGIDLSLTAPTKEDFVVNVNGHSVIYRQGILFTSGTDKGKALFNFCDMFGIHPSRIVFINDKASHLREIEKAANARNVEFIGLRYAFADIHKALYDPKIAEIQFTRSSFANILSDEEATLFLQN